MKTFHSRLTYFLEVLVCLSFLSFFTMVILLVGLRYLFNSSITGANEIITILFVYTTAIGAAIAVGQRGHIAINILIEKLPQRLAKHLAKLRKELDRWMNAQGDPGAPVDTPKAIQASKNGNHLHGQPATNIIR